ncbi:MAG: hypothetical protein IJT43_11290 [Stomatobaculum sp.]|nr:hypothetical protein [Stomatobaculum sp.]
MKRKALVLVLLVCLLSCTGCGDRMTKVRDLRRAGITAMEEGDYTGAAEQFRHAMAYYGTARQEGTEIDILRYLAEAEMRSQDYASAAETLRHLLEADSRKAEYLDMLSVCLVRSGGDLGEALALYNEAGESSGSPETHRQALYSLGEELSKSDDPALKEQVLGLYQKVIDEGGQTSGLCLRVGKFYFESGDCAWAKEVFREGQTLAEQELLQEELPEEKAEEIRKTLRDLRFNEAVCLEYEKDYAGALSILEEIAGEYGEDETLEHEILFLKTRV